MHAQTSANKWLGSSWLNSTLRVTHCGFIGAICFYSLPVLFSLSSSLSSLFYHCHSITFSIFDFVQLSIACLWQMQLWYNKAHIQTNKQTNTNGRMNQSDSILHCFGHAHTLILRVCAFASFANVTKLHRNKSKLSLDQLAEMHRQMLHKIHSEKCVIKIEMEDNRMTNQKYS